MSIRWQCNSNAGGDGACNTSPVLSGGSPSVNKALNHQKIYDACKTNICVTLP